MLRVHVVHVLVRWNRIAEDLQLLVVARSSQQGRDAFLTLILLDVLRPIDFLEIIILLLFIYKANELHTIVRNHWSGTGRLYESQLGGRRGHPVLDGGVVLLEDGLELVRWSLHSLGSDISILPALDRKTPGRSRGLAGLVSLLDVQRAHQLNDALVLIFMNLRIFFANHDGLLLRRGLVLRQVVHLLLAYEGDRVSVASVPHRVGFLLVAHVVIILASCALEFSKPP